MRHGSSHFLPDVPCGGWWTCLGLRRHLNQEAALRYTGLKKEDLVMFCDSNEVCLAAQCARIICVAACALAKHAQTLDFKRSL